MIPELGHFSLMVALAVALVLGTLPIIGAARGNETWMDLARPAARAVFVLVLVAAACLVASFVRDDFSVLYVATNSTRALPLRYKVAAFWGGHEGSMLLWLLILSFWMFAVSLFSRHLPQPMVARILGVMGLIGVGFLLFILLTSSPFDRLIPAPEEGRDLNPLLQDPGMVAHPPMLYMGYVGFSVAFAFAIAALLGGNLDATWARWSRPWTTVAWSFLTLGICLGSAWAYYTLGWGGWWFWDPVENASFMPWLAGTALMHSLAVTEKRGGFKVWTVLLAIFAFSLSLLGTFLVRSGVLTSVHAFANDPRRGVFILLFLSLVIGGSLALYAWRAPKVGLGERFELVSRETMLLTNNVLFLSAAGAVLLGTLYPLFLDSLGLDKISVGPPYFDVVFVPLMTPGLFLMGIGPLARWKAANLPEIGVRLKWAFGVSIVTALLLPLALGRWSGLAAFGLWLALWIYAATGVNLWSRLRPLAGSGLVARFRSLPLGYLGMLTAHVGVATFIVGVTLVKSYEAEKDVQMDIGDTVTMGPYTFQFGGVSNGSSENYIYSRGLFEVTRNGQVVGTMRPEKRQFLSQQQGEPSTVAAINRGLTRDLYVALGEPAGNNSSAWIVRVYYKPFVDWVWGGCLVMALGGVLALSDRRYRLARRAGQEAVDATLSGTVPA
ncbi:MAG TPA: heme lyase CcmF/NrfE family subunit [Burkholderiaceae bacterium]|jgi:cytochrome c-type biogenesis protein CcmF|nr:heme lyase CcmF/NrfE family subunit [Burkholderiaceae bacterium]